MTVPWHGDWSSAHMLWMGIWWTFLALAFLALVWFAVQRGRSGTDAGDSPELVLKRRYARGEIDRETYERMLDDLRK